MIKRCLVTGGAGYIGSHFVKKLIENTDYDVVVVDAFFQGRKNVINNSRAVYLEGNLLDLVFLSNVFDSYKFDLVVHFAALSVVSDSVTIPREYYHNNLLGGINLLDQMIRCGVKNIIYSSTAAVYGDPVDSTINEFHPLSPKTSYGSSKLALEQILINYNRAYGINSVTFRYFNAAGCDESLVLGENHSPETHIIPLLVRSSIFGEIFKVYGNDYETPDGSAIRDYVHVNDLAEAHILAIKKLNEATNICEVYNLGNGNGYSVFDLVGAIEQISGKKIEYQVLSRRAGDPAVLVAESSKAMSELGWKPKYEDVAKIIKTTYDYIKKTAQ